ncbi:hypothetical protein [Glycomyces buryatensis]|uniref:Uncharacterized protein n=1 Tax=Glycomyces buryatensis TaxID=2570927 RepID=A0A4S8QE85_9ACTN|nr:hypothetical protein [Glycomyces buryatensis]THV41402.1 hypothetical protein FAB82_11415 [Glycomyces buryatensis]
MPTFQQALDANPAQLMSLGAAIAAAAGKVTTLGAQHAGEVAGMGASWQGDDYQEMVRWGGDVAGFIGRSDAALVVCAGALESMGATMMATVTALKATKQSAEAIGYRVLPTPMVILGPSQWSQVSSAGPAAPAVLAAYQSGAVAFTAALASMYAALIAQDTAAYGIIRTAIGLSPS